MNSKNKKNKKMNFTFTLYIFAYIFAPPLIPKINFIFIVFLYSFFMIIIKYKKKVIEVLRNSGIKFFTQMMLIAYVYIGLVMISGVLLDPVNLSNYAKTLYRFFLVTPVIVTCVSYIILRCNELGYGLEELLKILIYAGLIQATIAIIMAISPTIKEFFIRIIYFNTGDTLTQNLWHIQRRYFAFSNNVLDTFGYGTGIISILPLIYGIYKKKYIYFLYTPILLIVPLLNSRTGLIIAFIGLISLLPYFMLKSSLKQVVKSSIIIIILIWVSFIGLDYLYELHPTTMHWVKSGIEDAIGFFRGEVGTDSVSIITSESNWYTPKSIYILTGTGHTIYGATGYSHSDVGYINDLWLGGIIGILLLYIPFIIIFIRAYKSRYHPVDKILIIFLMLSFFVANIKTIILSYNVGTSIVMLLTFFVIYNNYTLRKNID